MSKVSLQLAIVLVIATVGGAYAGGGSHSGPYIVPESTVTTAQIPGVAHSCKQDLHTASCVEQCKKNVTTLQTPGVAHNCRKDVHSPRCVNRCARNLATVDTAGVTHVCAKDVHNPGCIKKCVINTTETKPTGPPPVWHVRGGTAFPVRDRQAENALLDRLYNQRVKADIIKQ
jgi:hypothetical protein